jgi:hypothetical protein
MPMFHTQDWYDGRNVGYAETAEGFRSNLQAWLTDQQIDCRIGLGPRTIEEFIDALRVVIDEEAQEEAQPR